jgi:hypothetical protein
MDAILIYWMFNILAFDINWTCFAIGALEFEVDIELRTLICTQTNSSIEILIVGMSLAPFIKDSSF